MTALSLVALAVSVHLVIVRTWPGGGRGEAALVTAAVLPAALALEPVRETLSFGQVNLWLMALVVRIRWQDSVRYWFTGADPTTDVHGSPFATNQALAGALTRLGLGQPWESLIWVAVAGAVVWACALVVPPADAPTALVATAIAVLVLSPTSWSHHWVWIAPALIVFGARTVRRSRYLPATGGPTVAVTVFLTVFLIGPHHHLPRSRNKELDWEWWQHLYGNTYLLVALTTLLWVTRRPRQASTIKPRPDTRRGCVSLT